MELELIFRHEAISVVARTIYGEARGQPREGKVAVANVILNRVAASSWMGDDPAECCLWPRQFSCWNDDDPNRKVLLRSENQIRHGGNINGEFRECLEIAEVAIDGRLVDNTNGSTHYFNPQAVKTRPAWVKGKKPAVVLGDHEFYNNVE